MIDDFSKNKNKGNCCGCSACLNSCPKKAIRMHLDSEGFLYPSIDRDLCVHCDLCERVCQYKNKNMKHFHNTEYYYGYSKDKSALLESSSGGIFYEIAKKIIINGGVVYSSAYDYKHNSLHYICSDNLDTLKSTLKSKYIQAEMDEVFISVKKNLDFGKSVLFCGTPCCINGLSLFLKKNYENLFTIDFICHGVCSPKVWQQYLKESNVNPKLVDFRNKTFGWKNFCIYIRDDNKEVLENKNENVFFKLFLSNIILRPSCYNCKSKGVNRTSDLTLGDFRGAENFNVQVNENGTSLIIVNSIKGDSMLNGINASLYNCNSSFLKYNKSYYSSCKLPKSRRKVFKNLNKKTLDYLATKYTRPSWLVIAKQYTKMFLRKFKI